MGAEKSGAASYQCTHSYSPESPRSAAVLTRYRKHGFDYVVDVVVGHRGINRQGKATTVNVVGDRKIAVPVPVVALIVVHRVQRDAVYGASDAALAQHLDELVAADPEELGTEPQHVEMPRVLDAWLRVCSLQTLDGAKRLVVGARDLGAPALKVVGAFQLREPDRRVHVGKIIFETHVVNFVEPRAALVVALPRVFVHPVQTRDRDLFRERVIGGCDHPAFRGGEVLGRVETETGDIADGAYFRHPASVHVTRRSRRVRGIFDNFQIVLARDLQDSIHVAGLTRVVHRQERADSFVRTVFERLLDAGWADVEGAGIDVDEHRPRAEVAENLRGRGKCERGGDNFVAGTDAECPQRQVKRAGAVRYRERMFGAHVLGEFFFEALGLGPGRDPSGAKRLEHLALFLWSYRRTMKCYLSHRVRLVEIAESRSWNWFRSIRDSSKPG